MFQVVVVVEVDVDVCGVVVALMWDFLSPLFA